MFQNSPVTNLAITLVALIAIGRSAAEPQADPEHPATDTATGHSGAPLDIPTEDPASSSSPATFGSPARTDASGGPADRESASGPIGSMPDSEREVIPQGDVGGDKIRWTIHGYLRSEVKYNRLNLYYAYDDVLGQFTARGSPHIVFGLLPASSHDAYQELNFEVSWKYADWFRFYTDSSFIFTTTQAEQTSFEQLQDLTISVGDTTSGSTLDSGVPIPGAVATDTVRKEREKILINEAYADASIGSRATVTTGKRRISFGSAFIWSPMDVINPPKNPLEPNLQREGAYTASTDIFILDNLTLSALYRPYVLDNARGIPTEWDFERNLWVGRLYANLFAADANLAFYRNQGRFYGGLSFSRYFGLVEGHAEALVQRGRPTWIATPVNDDEDPYGDLEAPYSVAQSQLDNRRFYPEVVAGARYTFEDASAILLEYFYRSTGYSRTEFEGYRAFTAYMQEQLPHSISDSTQSDELDDENSSAVEATWTELLGYTAYLYTEPNVRRHYLGITALKSLMFDRIEPQMTVIVNLEDVGVTLSPAIDFSITPGSGRGFANFRAGALIFLGSESSQMSLYPNRFTANFRITARF